MRNSTDGSGQKGIYEAFTVLATLSRPAVSSDAGKLYSGCEWWTSSLARVSGTRVSDFHTTLLDAWLNVCCLCMNLWKHLSFCIWVTNYHNNQPIMIKKFGNVKREYSLISVPETWCIVSYGSSEWECSWNHRWGRRVYDSRVEGLVR